MLGLREVYALALTNDREWTAEQKRFQATEEVVPLARSGLMPNIGLSAAYGRVGRETETAAQDLDRHYNQDSIRIQARQPILNVERIMRVRIARQELSIGALRLAVAREDLLKRVFTAYFQLLLARELVDLSKAEITAIEAQKLQAQKMREGGIATLTDVHEAQARLDRALAEQVEAINALDIRKRQLAAIVGHTVDAVIPLGPRARFEPTEPSTPDFWVDLAVEQALVVRSRSLAAERERLNVERVQSQHLPTLDAVASYERASNTDLGFNRDRAGRIGVELTLPLYVGGRLDAESREAAARLALAREEGDLARRQAELEASTAYAELSNSLARIRALEQAVRSGEVALKGAEISYSVAYRSFIDVLNAQQLLFRSRFDLLRARFDYALALVRLRAAVGSLDDDMIEILDDWLDRTTHNT